MWSSDLNLCLLLLDLLGEINSINHMVHNKFCLLLLPSCLLTFQLYHFVPIMHHHHIFLSYIHWLLWCCQSWRSCRWCQVNRKSVIGRVFTFYTFITPVFMQYFFLNRLLISLLNDHLWMSWRLLSKIFAKQITNLWLFLIFLLLDRLL